MFSTNHDTHDATPHASPPSGDPALPRKRSAWREQALFILFPVGTHFTMTDRRLSLLWLAVATLVGASTSVMAPSNTGQQTIRRVMLIGSTLGLAYWGWKAIQGAGQDR